LKSKCKVCKYDLTDRPAGGMMKHRKLDRKLAKEYCTDHNDYKHTFKPVWKKCCGALSHYNLIIKKWY
jgi:hypothetical protein|tara:strand:- start:322 stop:525 length:204 start_codon:yes stop_codon:yes gene_type:complete